MKNRIIPYSNLKKVGVITVAYIVISLLMGFHNYAMVTSDWALGPSDLFEPWSYFFSTLFIGLVAGIFGGAMLVTINSRYFRQRSFGFAMVTTLVSFTIIFFTITLIVPYAMAFFFYNDQLIATDAIWIGYEPNMQPILFSNYIVWILVTLSTLFMLQINDKFGPGVLAKFITGKYHNPREEERIFMFMDMKSSTTIAEKLGNKMYFSMLQEVVNDITNAIISNRGEIYQYVGDEIVISWNLKKGIETENFISCFEAVQKKLREIGPNYEAKFGFRPEFKAGVHHGIVTAGEIGSIKRDIVYSGDVLNTASRIQNQCNNFGVNILISQNTFSLVEKQTKQNPTTIGEIELRGKEEKISLVTLN